MFSWFGKVSFVPYSKVQDFAVHLKDGRLMGSTCAKCGYTTFPPRADCPECMNGEFKFKEYTGEGEVYTYSTIAAAPTGFDDMAPYTVVVVDLKGGGRLVGWLGDTIKLEDLKIGMPIQVVPRIFEESQSIKLHYTVEMPGTTWGKAPAPHTDA
jgi:uncharacterized OB-fold protein